MSTFNSKFIREILARSSLISVKLTEAEATLQKIDDHLENIKDSSFKYILAKENMSKTINELKKLCECVHIADVFRDVILKGIHSNDHESTELKATPQDEIWNSIECSQYLKYYLYAMKKLANAFNFLTHQQPKLLKFSPKRVLKLQLLVTVS